MSLLNAPAYDWENESDVERKFLYPSLTRPTFLAVPSKSISTESGLGSMPFVAKSALPKNDIPDYPPFFDGLPICLVEAKQPEVSIETAVEEARLYGQVRNQS
jgi:hypothetical protein